MKNYKVKIERKEEVYVTVSAKTAILATEEIRKWLKRNGKSPVTYGTKEVKSND